MTNPEQTAAMILVELAESILRDRQNNVQDIRRQCRQCEQMLQLARKELELSDAKQQAVA